MKHPFIRRAVLADALGIHESHMHSIREICAPDYSAAQIDAWGGRPFNEAARVKAINEQMVWVVESEGLVEGHAHLGFTEKDGSRIAYVFSIYLTPVVVGRDLGKELIGLMKSEAELAGFHRLELESSITSQEFYRRLGFRELGPRYTVYVNGVPIPCIPMALDF